MRTRCRFPGVSGARTRKSNVSSSIGQVEQFHCPSRRNKEESARYYSENPNAMIVAPAKHRRRVE